MVTVEWDRRSRFAERCLPTDIVYVTRLFGDAVAGAVDADDAEHCELNGDDVVVLFGLDGDLAAACRKALAAAMRIEHALDALRARLAREFALIARFTVVVHAGHAAVGDIGTVESRRLIVVGAASEGARLLRDRAIELAAPFIVSRSVTERAGALWFTGDASPVEVVVDGQILSACAMSSLHPASATASA